MRTPRWCEKLRGVKKERSDFACPSSKVGAWWSVELEPFLAQLGTNKQGLAQAEAERRLRQCGLNSLGQRKQSAALPLLLRQFTTPIVLLLILASLLSWVLEDSTDAWIILGIVVVSGILGFWQERGAAVAVEKLLETIELKARVVRDGESRELPVVQLVPGEVVLLAAGAAIPADCRLLAARDLFVDEAALTGESYPVAKNPGVVAPEVPVSQRENAVFLGTHVVSGFGTAVVVCTGRATELGRVSQRLRRRPPETEFEHGVRRFGYLLLEITLVMTLAVLALNVLLQRPVLDSFLFALALAVGLTPQLLPAIISVNLARGAQRMAQQQVLVKRLAAIENFGSMDVLCSDKTGTLTVGKVQVHAALDVLGRPSDRVLFFAFLNAAYETAFQNPLDEALRTYRPFALDDWHKLDEVPYDFGRKRLSVLVEHGAETIMVTKGALRSILDVCTTAEKEPDTLAPIRELRAALLRTYEDLTTQGFRTLGVAIKRLDGVRVIDRDSESEMTFLGLLAFSDPLKPGVAEIVASLERLGVRLKIVSGDQAQVAARVAGEVGFATPRVLTGTEVRGLSDDALAVRAEKTDVFAEIEPIDKERIVRALRKLGHVVGYMGDGINDAPALHAADVSLSVQGAVDVAKEAADIVLLEKDLAVLEAGVREGRRTFANTLKYVFMASSANFGNMFSMAGASLLLPFLPLLPKQILLTNLLTDLPELTIATDRVDPDWMARPHRWDVGFIRKFMAVFGLASSLFDYITFAVLRYGLEAGDVEFRTGWFVESVVSAAVIVLVLRTRMRSTASLPARGLLLAVIAVSAVATALPFSPLGALFDFVPLPPAFLVVVLLIVFAYGATVEGIKRWFYQRIAQNE